MADRVILALPFSILRSSVDLSQVGFGSLKRTAIAEQGMGTNSKLHVQFRNRHWELLGSNGDTFSDRGYQNTWEVTRAQSGRSGILVDYTGGEIGASSYSYWKVGQYTGFSGIEREPEGNCFFCGEHTSIDFQGYLNGAVETGERAAGEVVDSLG
jgi:monoamine oxidase